MATAPPPEPPPPPIDCARMPGELISTVVIEPMLRTLTAFPSPPLAAGAAGRDGRRAAEDRGLGRGLGEAADAAAAADRLGQDADRTAGGVVVGGRVQAGDAAIAGADIAAVVTCKRAAAAATAAAAADRGG